MKRFAIALLISAFLSSACTKDAEIQERDYPLVRTFLSSTYESITFTGEIFSKGSQEIISYGFVFDTLYGKKYDTIHFSGKPADKFNITLQAGFAPDKLYQMRAFIRTREEFIFGNKHEFVFNGSKPVELISFSPSRGTTGDTVIIQGRYFSRAIGGNIVLFGQDTAKVVRVEENMLYVRVPEIPEDQICQISVKTASSSALLEGEFERWYNWTRIIDSIPGHYHRGTKAGDYFVLFDNWTESTIVCNVETGSLSTVQFPGSVYSYYDPIFTCDDRAYFFCNGSKQLWQYDPVTDEWTRKNDIPTGILTYQKPLVFGSIAYFIVSGNNTTEIWEYDSVTDIWTLKDEISVSHLYPEISVTADGKAYLYCIGSDVLNIYEFDPSEISLKYLTDYPGLGQEDLSAFFIEGKVYFGLGNYDEYYHDQALDLWEFNPQTLQWKESHSFPKHAGNRSQILIYSQDGFVVRDYYTSNITEVYKFDPTKR